MPAFDNSYARLPDRFHARVAPTPVAAPRLVRLNAPLAALLGLDPAWLASDAGIAALAGNEPMQGAEPIAAAYAGHQFGNFTPQLGDGRAILLGELIGRDGRRRDVQLKGSGPTPWSRMGDGRAAIGPVLREYAVSEWMHAAGVPTTRALAAVASGDTVLRERPLPGGVLCRVASSHIRVGSFQYFAAREDFEAVRALADHAIARHYPACAEAANPYAALIAAVAEAQARLVARWMLLGFVHGVMNTDNMSVAGETIDYGPCAFMDAYHPATLFSSIDRQGRYAYANQPRIALWNLARLAETLLPLLADEETEAVAMAEGALAGFAPAFEGAQRAGFRAKIGLMTAREDDAELMQALLTAMAENQADFTLFFRTLAHAAEGDDSPARDLFVDPTAFDRWAADWRARLAQEPATPAERAAAMRAASPALIPRNHRVQEAIAAAEAGDFAPFNALCDALADPFGAAGEASPYATPPLEEERVTRTFCGT